MRILHLTSSFSNGAGTAALRIHQAQLAFGLNSEIITKGRVDRKLQAGEEVIIRETHQDYISKTVTFLQRNFVQKNENLITPFSYSTLRLNEICKRKPDLVNIHATYNLLNFKSIDSLIKHGIPVVFSLHDERAYTAGCHNSFGCTQFQQHCTDCPFSTRVGMKLVASIHDQEIMRSKGLVERGAIIAPSRWILERALLSSKLSGIRSYHIPNPIPEIFSKLNRVSNTEPNRVKRIGFCASNINSNFKGLKILLDALVLLHRTSSVRFKLVIIGKGYVDKSRFNFEIEQSQTQDDAELAAQLANLDLLIVPSIGDNAPSVIPEAQLSGTTVIGSNVGGIPEMLNNDQDRIFDVTSKKSIVNCIAKNLNSVNFKPSYNSSRYNYFRVGEAYNHVYATLLSEKN